MEEPAEESVKAMVVEEPVSVKAKVVEEIPKKAKVMEESLKAKVLKQVSTAFERGVSSKSKRGRRPSGQLPSTPATVFSPAMLQRAYCWFHPRVITTHACCL